MPKLKNISETTKLGIPRDLDPYITTSLLMITAISIGYLQSLYMKNHASKETKNFLLFMEGVSGIFVGSMAIELKNPNLGLGIYSFTAITVLTAAMTNNPKDSE